MFLVTLLVKLIKSIVHTQILSILDDIYNKNITVKKSSRESVENIHPSRQETDGDAMKAAKEDIVVIAKHLCGAGTDLALKSIKPIHRRVKACVLATCCHGICTWDDYVGRDYLRTAMKTNRSSTIVSSFGRKEFDLMKRWAAGTVMNHNKDSGIVIHDDHISSEQHSNDVVDEGGNLTMDVCNIRNIVSSLNLQCGVHGLGRACQRLIDYGRCQYMEKDLFQTNKRPAIVNMCHYVPSDVTPQNALLKAINH